MPLPKPRKNEPKDAFRARCMSDSTVVSEYPKEKQRYAVCLTQFNNNKKEL